MVRRPFHLSYFTKFGPPAWRAHDDRLAGGDWWDGRYFVDLARRLEAACVDFLFLEDTVNVANTYKNRMDEDLRYAIYSPKHDPLQLLPFLAGATERIGLVGTASTSFHSPYGLARALSTLDSLSGGRAGWNIVTSSETAAAQNFGMDSLPSPIERYDRADEFVDAATSLWNSWEEGAVIRDESTDTYIDPTKVHVADYAGRYHRTRGPLNTVRSPQGTPVLAQAGYSSRGRDFSARHADVIFALPGSGVDEMKALRADLRGRAASFGRNPDDIKIFWGVFVYITDDPNPPARDFTGSALERELVVNSTFFDLDLSQYDLDQPMPEDAVALGHTSMLSQLQEWGRQGMTLRQGVTMLAMGSDEIGLSGTAKQVASNVTEVMDEVGGDGLMLFGSDWGTERFVSSIVDEFIPELQALGAVRTSYSGRTLRENLRAF